MSAMRKLHCGVGWAGQGLVWAANGNYFALLATHQHPTKPKIWLRRRPRGLRGGHGRSPVGLGCNLNRPVEGEWPDRWPDRWPNRWLIATCTKLRRSLADRGRTESSIDLGYTQALWGAKLDRDWGAASRCRIAVGTTGPFKHRLILTNNSRPSWAHLLTNMGYHRAECVTPRSGLFLFGVVI